MGMGNMTRYICIKPPTFTFSGNLKNWMVACAETIEHFFFCSFSLFFCFCTESGVDWKAIEAWFAGILLSSTCQLLQVPLAEMWGRDRYHTHRRNIRSQCSAFVERYCTLHCGDGQTPHSLVSGWLRGATEPWSRYRYQASQRYCYPTIAPQGYS